MSRRVWKYDEVVACDDLYRREGKVGPKHPEVVKLAREFRCRPKVVSDRIRELAEAHAQPGYPGKRWHFTKMDRQVADR